MLPAWNTGPESEVLAPAESADRVTVPRANTAMTAIEIACRTDKNIDTRPSPRITRTFFFMTVVSVRPCEGQK
jgi:hypothetical protein